MDIEIRAIAADEFDAYMRMFEDSFSGVIRPDEIEIERTVTEFDRCLVAIDGDAFVGGSCAASMTMAVPGEVDAAVAGITGVAVKPTHRRRGINTALMRRQLDDVHERGEPLAALHASEGGIYGRFGFGVSTFNAAIEVDASRAAFVRGYQPSGRVRLLPRDQALPLIRQVYDRARRQRPAGVALDDRWFAWLFFVGKRDEDEPPFWAVHVSDEGEPDAFAVYKVKHSWPGSVPSNELSLDFLVSTTPQSHADMWRYVFDIDLVQRVGARSLPVDEPLLHLVQEPRRLRFTVKDGIWMRLVDVPSALTARRYRGEGRVVLEVRDRFCGWNEGRFALEVRGDEIDCSPTHEDPEIACSVNDLGAAYLGGSTFSELARAGFVTEEREGALRRIDAIFATDIAPWSSMSF